MKSLKYGRVFKLSSVNDTHGLITLEMCSAAAATTVDQWRKKNHSTIPIAPKCQGTNSALKRDKLKWQEHESEAEAGWWKASDRASQNRKRRA